MSLSDDENQTSRKIKPENKKAKIDTKQFDHFMNKNKGLNLMNTNLMKF
jgi:hypothetical protein